MFAWIYWDPDPNLFIIPGLNWAIKWYGLFFASGFALGAPLFKAVLSRYFQLTEKNTPLVELKVSQIGDKIVAYIAISAILGARIGHFFFYESPSQYLKNPLEIFYIREGGLASHGAVIAILISLGLFQKFSPKISSELSYLKLIDFVCVPTALAAGLIRLGNFMNQEILGMYSALPWAVMFGHPIDGSFPIPRHPVQLYEAGAYFLIFYVLWKLSYVPSLLRVSGRLSGIFFMSVFGSRFIIEFFKLEQSNLESYLPLLKMGQWLSLPLVALGLIVFFLNKKSLLDPFSRRER